MFCVCPFTAQAASASDIAFSRCVKAIEAYATEPTDISVNVADLGLTERQLQAVIDRVHYDGRFFWVNTFAATTDSTKTIVYPCTHSDATITKMRATYRTYENDALSCISKSMTAAEKVHALHDWLIRRANYKTAASFDTKSSYGVIAQGKGDCLSFTLGMRVLLRDEGFTTSVAINDNIPDAHHVWNLVKFGGHWYHVDVTWDNSYTGRYFWKKSICHKYLLKPDAIMNLDTHKGWTASYKCTSKKYVNTDWEKHCSEYLKVSGKFTRGGMRYKVVGTRRVKIISCSLSKATSVTVASSVLYKGFLYKVTGIGSKAFRACTRATILKIKTKLFTKKSIRGALISSHFVSVKVPSAKYDEYRAYLKKTNSGRRVTVGKL